jgi:hypothetical protein
MPCISNCYGNRGPVASPVEYGILIGQGSRIQFGGIKRNEWNVTANIVVSCAPLSPKSPTAMVQLFAG